VIHEWWNENILDFVKPADHNSGESVKVNPAFGGIFAFSTVVREGFGERQEMSLSPWRKTASKTSVRNRGFLKSEAMQHSEKALK
jgi:hypothetical protein